MVVVRQDQLRPRPERVRFAHQPASARGVGGKDSDVFLGWGVEMGEDRYPGALDQIARLGRGRVLRMRATEAPSTGPLDMGAELRLRWQTGAGVVQINVAAGIEVGVFRGPQAVKRPGTPIAGVGRQETGRLRPPVIFEVDAQGAARLFSIVFMTFLGTSVEVPTGKGGAGRAKVATIALARGRQGGHGACAGFSTPAKGARPCLGISGFIDGHWSDATTRRFMTEPCSPSRRFVLPFFGR